MPNITTPTQPLASGRRTFSDFFGGFDYERDPDLPRPGDQIWYRVRSDRRWVRAVVLDPRVESLDDPIGMRMLHLAIDLTSYNSTMTLNRIPDGEGGFIEEPDPERRLASGRLGYRFNVIEGTRPGEWQREQPADAETVYATEQAEQERLFAFRRQQAMEGGLSATHVGRLPRGVK